MGTQPHECSVSSPEISLVGQQIVCLIGPSLVNSKSVEVQIDPAGMCVVGIDVDHDQRGPATLMIGFAVNNQRGIVDRMKTEIGVTLEFGVVTANLVDLGDQVPERVAAIQIPLPQLIFLRVKVFFLAGFDRDDARVIRTRARRCRSSRRASPPELGEQ